jgi:hypothetical protein
MEIFFYISSLVFALLEVFVGALCLMLALQSKRTFDFIGAAFMVTFCVRALLFLDLPVIFQGWPK